MRRLTLSQKKACDIFFSMDTCDAFSCELLEKLEKINDTEILCQNINRYIGDKVAKDMI